jgi:hypothetical protein
MNEAVVFWLGLTSVVVVGSILDDIRYSVAIWRKRARSIWRSELNPRARRGAPVDKPTFKPAKHPRYVKPMPNAYAKIPRNPFGIKQTPTEERPKVKAKPQTKTVAKVVSSQTLQQLHDHGRDRTRAQNRRSLRRFGG